MKKVLYVIIAIGIIYLILCFFGPKQVMVEREITINQPAEVIRPKLADLKFFHDSWSPWTEKDPNMKTSYEGTPGTVGHLYTWSGNKEVREGSMLISNINGDTVRNDMTFDHHGGTVVNLITKGNGNTSTVKWQMVMPVGFFGRTPMLFMNMDKMMGPDFEKGLAKLKTAMESMPAKESSNASYEVKEMEWPEKTFVGKKAVLPFDKIAAFYGENLGKLFGELAKNKIEPQMAPLGIFWKYDEQKKETEMAAAVCVPNGTKLKGYESWDVPASKVLQIVYYGDYAKVAPAHMAMDDYMKKHNMKQSLVIEEYANDPGTVKDTAQWMTNIYYVIGK